MAKNITLMGASYSDVPAVDLPQTGGGTARFMDTSDATADEYSLLEGATAYVNGVKITGVIPQLTEMTGDIAQYFITENNQRKWKVEGLIRTNQGGVVYPGASFGTGEYTYNAVPANTVITPTSSVQTVGGANWMMEGAITINAGSGSSKNAQTAQSTTRSTSSAYTEVISLTCTKAGKYDVYWSTFRSSTSGTWGSQLYIDDTAYGSAETGSWSNHIQNIHLSNVTLSANADVAVRVRTRGSNYYGYVGTLTIIEA